MFLTKRLTIISYCNKPNIKKQIFINLLKTNSDMETRVKDCIITRVDELTSCYKIYFYTHEFVGNSFIKFHQDILINKNNIQQTIPKSKDRLSLVLATNGDLVGCCINDNPVYKFTEEEYQERQSSFKQSLSEQIKLTEKMLKEKYGQLSSIFYWRRKMMKEYAPHWAETQIEVLYYYVAQRIYFICDNNIDKINSLSSAPSSILDDCLPIKDELGLSSEALEFCFKMARNLHHEKNVGSNLSTLKQSKVMLQSTVDLFG